MVEGVWEEGRGTEKNVWLNKNHKKRKTLNYLNKSVFKTKNGYGW